MDARKSFPSNYIKAADIGDHKPIVKIAFCKIETLGFEGDQEEKPVLGFEGKEKKMVLNVTNNNTLIDMFGFDTEDWIGKSITLCTALATFKGKSTMALRIVPQRVDSKGNSSVRGDRSPPPVKFENQTPENSKSSDMADEDIPF